MKDPQNSLPISSFLVGPVMKLTSLDILDSQGVLTEPVLSSILYLCRSTLKELTIVQHELIVDTGDNDWMLETSFQQMECLERVVLDGPKITSIKALTLQSYQPDGQGRLGIITLEFVPYRDVFGSSLDLVQIMNTSRWQTVCLAIELGSIAASGLPAEQEEILLEAQRVAEDRGIDLSIDLLEVQRA
jgi:hypothetical protein